MNCRVVWGLKEPFKLPEENEKFWVRAWLPQIEALSHSAVKACLTHGGMGGCMECIGSETPAITFPHFADQQPNSECLVKAGGAIALYNKLRMEDSYEAGLTFKEPIFTSQKIKEVFTEVSTNPKYAANMKRLKYQAMTSGGAPLAVQTIEREYINAGNSHLRDDEVSDKMSSMSLATACCTDFIWFLVQVALIVFTVLYFLLASETGKM